MSKTTELVQRVCGCGHPVTAHNDGGCGEWWRYPDVLDARPCACRGVWRPGPEHSQYERWANRERRS